jgi:AcrR family transcriptional regulator
VAAGIEYADEHGIEALTVRELGKAMGASATAIYRYFPNKEDLLSAMRDELLGEVVRNVDLEGEPRILITDLAAAFRTECRKHPCLSQLMVLSRLEGPTADALPVLVGVALQGLGLKQADVALAYRQLESLILGSTVFDFSGAPEHLSERRRRLGALTDLGFDRVLTDDAAVDALNEAAFEANLQIMLDALVAQAAQGE